MEVIDLTSDYDDVVIDSRYIDIVAVLINVCLVVKMNHRSLTVTFSGGLHEERRQEKLHIGKDNR